MTFRDRIEAGRHLASLLESYRHQSPVVLGLVRGGMAVAAQVAEALAAPLDVLIVRKVGVPGHDELAMGAVARGTAWLNQPLIADLGIPREVVERRIEEAMAEVGRRETIYREGQTAVPVRGRTAILVDDGLATGATALAGVRVLRQLGAGRVVFAAPVCSIEGRARVAEEADDVVCFSTPADFQAVSQAYLSFPQLDDQAVRRFLEAAGSADMVRGGQP
jgi:putative phosphoribosyl transferase